jgi:hypothetical protein
MVNEWINKMNEQINKCIYIFSLLLARSLTRTHESARTHARTHTQRQMQVPWDLRFWCQWKYLQVHTVSQPRTTLTNASSFCVERIQHGKVKCHCSGISMDYLILKKYVLILNPDIMCMYIHHFRKVSAMHPESFTTLKCHKGLKTNSCNQMNCCWLNRSKYNAYWYLGDLMTLLWMQRLYTYSVKWNGKIMNGDLDKDMEGGGHGLFEGAILAFSWRDWGKPQRTSAR